MRGIVTPNEEAIVTLTVRGPNGTLEVEAKVDTGFSGYLTLSPSDIASLGLPFAETVDGRLASGARKRFDTFYATVLEGRSETDAFIMSTQGDVLLGMGLMRDHLLTVEVINGGDVSIEPLD